ncbi:MAG: NAD-dependent epimerase/dehydratase family protein [Wenzhouxiangellaceae bacterium]
MWLQSDLDQEPVHSDGTVLIAAGAIRHASQALAVMPRLAQVIAFSSSSVINKQNSPDAGEQAVVNELLAHERRLAEACAARGITLTVLRPTMIYGCGLDRNLCRIAGWLQRRRWFPLGWPGRGRRQPVHADDLAQLTLRCLALGAAAAGTFAVGGGTVLDYREMVRRVGAALNVKVRFIVLPVSLFAPMLDYGARFAALRGLNGAMIRRQNEDLLVDDRPARQVLNWHPQAFEPRARHFQSPA